MNSLTVVDTRIRQDAEGRYNLGDLHKAAGKANRSRPSIWLANQQTKALIAELQDDLSRNFCLAPVKSVKGGRSPGTYVCKELVYAYAMWISPAFHLQVIRAYDALVSGQIEEAEGRASRQQARLESPALTEAVKLTRESAGKTISHYHFSNEFDLINRIALGMTAKKYRKEHGLDPRHPVRDTLTPREIKCIEHLQRANATMIELGMEFEQRKNELSKLYARRHAAGLLREVEQLEA